MDTWNLTGGQLKILTQSEIEEIHQRALDVLQQVGCFFESEDALAIFEKHGAVVGHSSRVVKLPPQFGRGGRTFMPFFNAAGCP